MISMMRSVIHKDAPPNRRYVRGELESSGFIIKQHPDEPSWCNVTYLVQIDPKGRVPSSVESSFHASRPLLLAKIRELLEKESTRSSSPLPPISPKSPLGPSRWSSPLEYSTGDQPDSAPTSPSTTRKGGPGSKIQGLLSNRRQSSSEEVTRIKCEDVK